MSVHEYKFKIDAFTPDTLPLNRLAEYMKELAILYGSQEHVHFVRLEGGSVGLVKKVDFESEPKVAERLQGVKRRTAPVDALEAYKKIDRMLAEDNATGIIETEPAPDDPSRTAKIIEFPGRNRELTEDFGPVSETTTLDGHLIRIGGKDATVPVLLQDEEGTEY